MAKSTETKEESLYTVDEMAACAKQVFHTNQDIVRAALRVAGVKRTTVGEAAKIVDKFRKKEV